ncbi:hypothetical protein GCM10010245_29260 [Streptomyces spectabilis]|nr:hypothetical protein GCM10010245_29260 [Streptomyces spectabilis]
MPGGEGGGTAQAWGEGLDGRPMDGREAVPGEWWDRAGLGQRPDGRPREWVRGAGWGGWWGCVVVWCWGPTGGSVSGCQVSCQVGRVVGGTWLCGAGARREAP